MAPAAGSPQPPRASSAATRAAGPLRSLVENGRGRGCTRGNVTQIDSLPRALAEVVLGVNRWLLFVMLAACSGATATTPVRASGPSRDVSSTGRSGTAPTAAIFEVALPMRAATTDAAVSTEMPAAFAAPVEVEPDPVASGGLTGCERDVEALPVARGSTARDLRRLREGRVLVAHKSARRLMLYEAGGLQACWRMGLGFAPTGHKQVEGDGKTPEGWYPTSDKPWSVFDDAIAIHYPATRDAAEALADHRIRSRQYNVVAASNLRRAVPPQRTPMGGAILIHGGGSSSDWTLGCIALEDQDLGDLRSRLPKGMKTDLLIVR